MSLHLKRKLTLRAHGRQVVLVKKPFETIEHVLVKACLWALYLPRYPELQVERSVGDRFKPDVVALDGQGQDRPRFWGEAGEVARHKVRSLARRYPDTHFALAKWDGRMESHAELTRTALAGVRRRAPFELLGIPTEVARAAVREDGSVRIGWGEVERVELSP